ncbi:reverse transcriptase domain-containing protein [Tanacetum coccineum]
MSGSPTPSFDPVVESLSHYFTPFGDSDLLLEETNAFHSLDDSIPPGIDNGIYDSEGDILFLEELLNKDPTPNLPPPLLVMPFGLCNAPGTFQRCMVAIFYDTIEKTMEVFMDDFLVFGDSFSSCLSHLDMMLKWCEDTNLVLNEEKCHFMSKSLLSSAIRYLNLDLPFELMCDASDFAVGAVLGQRKDKYFRPIHYAMYTNHSALKYLFSKQDANPRLLWWILLLQEFNIEIRDKKGAKNLAADHLRRLESPHQGDLIDMEMNENFPHESLNMISLNPDNEPPWFADIANYLVGNVLIKGMSSQQLNKFFKDV